MNRLLTLIATATIATGFPIANSFAQDSTFSAAPPANLHPPVHLDADTLRAQLAPSQLGLKRQSGSIATGIDLPLGLNYSRDTKGLVVPLDEKNEWGVGVGLQMNSSRTIELSPTNTLGQELKRAPGLMLHRKF